MPLASTDKYEEALAKARFEYKENPCATENEKKLLEIIFPELKESDDEKIRRFLVELVSNDKFNDYGGLYKDRNVLYDDVLAYLEKQKEQKPESCDCSRDEESYTNGIHHVLMNPEAYGLIKLKPAKWSEEDEKFAYFVNQFLGYYEKTDPTAMSCKKWFNNRFKFLSPQPHWKPREEQINALAKAIIRLGEQGDNKTVMYLNEIRTELKKL